MEYSAQEHLSTKTAKRKDIDKCSHHITKSKEKTLKTGGAR